MKTIKILYFYSSSRRTLPLRVFNFKILLSLTQNLNLFCFLKEKVFPANSQEELVAEGPISSPSSCAFNKLQGSAPKLPSIAACFLSPQRTVPLPC